MPANFLEEILFLTTELRRHLGVSDLEVRELRIN
jgi:hypothetical protein